MKLSLLAGITEIVGQVTSYSKMFEVGSRHLIHGRTIIKPLHLDTLKQEGGLSKATPS